MKKYLVLILVILLCSGCDYLDSFDVIKTNDYDYSNTVVERPIFAGRDVIIYNLALFVPNDFNTNEYNGTYDIYEYYTGYATGSGPNGVDILIKTQEVDNNFAIEKWVVEESYAKSQGAHINKNSINGYNWYVGNINYSYFYYAVFNNRLYEVSISKKDDPTMEYDTARDMLEKSLYFQK